MTDLTGQKFGMLTVISYAGQGKWTCLCDCGKEKDVRVSNLKRAKSCGCKRGGKASDLTGQRFGKLVVISRAENKNNRVQWNCICDCGGKAVVSAGLLKSGGIKRCCGDLCSPLNFKDLTGKKFGKLTVISKAEKDKHNRIRWNCLCDCGNRLTPYTYSLLSGKSKSCGSCIKIIDLTGQRFGKLVVLSRASRDERTGQIRWNCLCDCGNNCVVLAKSLYSGNTKSCGCLVRYADPTLSSKKSLYRKYSRSAMERGYLFDISYDDFLNLISLDCYYCGSPASHYYKAHGVVREGGFFYNGLDRVDSSRGYQLDNVVSCCKRCNYLKWEKNGQDFLSWLKACHDHLFNKPPYRTITLSEDTRSAQNSLYWYYKNVCARYRGYDFGLSFEEFIQLTQQNCFYCGSPPVRYFQKLKSQKGLLYNGLDRVDNHIGYFRNNVVPCCKKCNESKSDLSHDAFVGHIEKCYNHLLKFNNPLVSYRI